MNLAKHEEHCADCMAELGQTFSEVHAFLDSHHRELGYSHRMVLHHSLGIEIVRRFFGEKGALAAEIHIRRDCNGEVPEPEDWMKAEELIRMRALKTKGKQKVDAQDGWLSEW